MANIKSFPNNQDEYVGAEHVMRWLHGRTSGVFGADGNASVAPVLDSMAVTVSDGNGWISNDNSDGVVWWIDNEETSGNKLQLEIDMADAVLPRIDRVVVSWQTTNYVALPEVKILKGTAASNPVAPTLTNNNVLRQISLASIRIPSGATAITGSMITDERLNPEVCGLVTESITADTRVINAQYLDAVEKLRNAIIQAWNGEISDGAISIEKLSDDTKKMIAAVNILDNSYFKNAVNQRDVTSFTAGTSSKYVSIDRWRFCRCSGSVSDEGLTFRWDGVNNQAGFMQQKVDKAFSEGDVITVGAKIDGSVYAAAFTLGGNDTELYESLTDDAKVGVCRVNNTLLVNLETSNTSGITAEWMALYEGEYTLDTLPEYQPKGYIAELMECQRYYCLLESWRSHVGLANYNGTLCTINVGTPVPMRTNPSLSGNGATTGENWTIYADAKTFTPSSVQIGGLRKNSVEIKFTTSGISAYAFVQSCPEKQFGLSADL